MKSFFISIYILLIDALIIYLGVDLIEWVCSIANDSKFRVIYCIVFVIICFNTVYLIDSLIEKTKEKL